MNQRLKFKILVFAFKCCNDLAPGYLSDLTSHYKPTRELHSSSSNNLVVPKFNLNSYGHMAFSVAAPLLWNTLSVQLKCELSLDVFKSKLKTFLFNDVHKRVTN